jgi:hypothetical protein
MHESFGTQLSELAGYADRNASLAPAAALRSRSTRRTTLHGSAVALLGGGAVAVAVSLGVTHAGAGTPPHSTTASSPGSVQLTADQTAVLTKAHVTTSEVTALAKAHLTPAQIEALAKVYRSVEQITGAGNLSKPLTAAQAAAIGKVNLTLDQILALDKENLTPAQIEAIANANLTAAQLAQG